MITYWALKGSSFIGTLGTDDVFLEILYQCSILNLSMRLFNIFIHRVLIIVTWTVVVHVYHYLPS